MDASVETRLARLRAAQDCRNLAARLMYYGAAGQWDEARALFAGESYTPPRDLGFCPVDVYADALDTEFLEVAPEGGRAFGLWLSPGSVTLPAREGRESAVMWDWTEYAFSFLKTPEGWRIENVQNTPVFRSGYMGEGLQYTPYVMPGLPEFGFVGGGDGEAEARLARMESAQACRNLMGAFCRRNAAGLSAEDLWSGGLADYLICPAGEFYGVDARRAPETGVLFELDTEILEVDSDCRTAAGCWNSPGNGGGHWYWGKFEVLFLRGDRGWRIHRMAYYPVFRTPMDTPWTESAGYAPNAALEKTDCRWAADRIHPAGRPEAPGLTGPYTRLSVE